MKKIRFILFLMLALLINKTKAQQKFPGASPGYSVPNPNAFVDVPTPTTSSLGKYGDIDVSYFTGNPKISIPLYNFNVRGVSLPITLDYDARGVMPNSLPSWVGQNWTLNVGGVIIRTVKGRYDEWKYPQQVLRTIPYVPKNYFQAYNKLQDLLSNNWSNYKELKDNIDRNEYDFAPDEFTFHFMGKSGKFFLDQNGNWRVKSKDNLEIIFDYNNPENFIGSLFEKYPEMTVIEQPCKTIAGFIIRDEEGNEYTFGYKKDAIEYTTSIWHMTEHEDNETWHASAWYLTNVKDKYGNKIYTLDYERGHYIIQIYNVYYNDSADEKASGMLGASTRVHFCNRDFPFTISLSSPVYLEKIDALNGISGYFYSEPVGDNLATEKIYSSIYTGRFGVVGLFSDLLKVANPLYYEHYNSSIDYFYYLQSDAKGLADYRYPTDNRLDILGRARMRKLTRFAINSDKSKPSDYIGFRFYLNDKTNRLCLDSVKIQDDAIFYSPLIGINGIYKFKYNQFDRIPKDYLTSCVDHWGYYNGTPYKYSDGNYAQNLELVRNPQINYTSIGILDEIIYPTGGLTCFEYEPNDYSLKLTNDRQNIISANGIGGGLRIKSIKTYDSDNKKELLSQKDFEYKIPNTDKSSGELFATPLYSWKEWDLKCELKNASYKLNTFHTSSVVPLANSSGVSLGYTYVTEKIKDNKDPNKTIEKRIYRYSNLSDPSTRDQRFLLTFGYADQFTPYDEFSELDFKRGNLLNEEVYNENDKKVKSLGYKYRQDNYLDNYVLSSNLVYECYGNSAQYYHYLGGVYKIYYPKYDFVEIQDTIYEGSGDGKMITSYSYQKSDIKYTSWRPFKHEVNFRILNSETKRRGSFTETNIFTYGDFNANNGNDSLLYKGMSYIKPLSIRYEKNGQHIFTNKTTYEKNICNKKEKLVPSYLIRENNANIKDTLIHYYYYTDTGMPQIIDEKGKPTTFLKWAYNDCYLVLSGHTYIPVTISQELFLNRKECLSYLQSFIESQKTSKYTGYIWNPLWGLTDIIQSNGNVYHYNYNKFGQLVGISDYNDTLLKQYQYNYRK